MTAEHDETARRCGDQLLALAEQATLGSLLLDPTQIDAISPWLRPEDHCQPRHQLLHRALLDHRQAGATCGPEDLLRWLEARGHLKRTYLDAPYLADCLNAPPRVQHAPAYARMVLEASIARTAGQHLLRLAQAAAHDRQTLQEQKSLARVALADLVSRAHHGRLEARTTSTVVTSPVSAPNHLDHDELTIVAAAVQAGAGEALQQQIDPRLLHDPRLRALLAATSELRQGRQPVDALTTVWTAWNDGRLEPHPGPRQWVRLLTTHPGVGVADAARTLADRAERQRIHSLAGGIDDRASRGQSNLASLASLRQAVNDVPPSSRTAALRSLAAGER